MVSSLFLSIGLFYAILILPNIPAPFLRLQFDEGQSPKLSYAPPGFVIPIVWFVLFTLLGLARYVLLRSGQSPLQWWLVILAALCALYAYYTLGLEKLTGISALWLGLAGNILVIVFAAFVFLRLLPVSATVAWLVLPIIVWTIYASLIVIGEMKLAGLL